MSDVDRSTDVTTTRPAGGVSTRRPALAAVLMFIAGIALHGAAPPWPIVWIGVAMVCGIIAARTIARDQLSSACVALALVACGLCAAQLAANFYPRAEIGRFTTDHPRLAQLELLIDHEPRVLVDQFAGQPLPPKQIVDARVTRVLTNGGWIDASGELLVQIVQPNPLLAIGQRVRVLGMLERPAPPANPGQFDWAAYYRAQRILASIHIPTAANIQILSPSHLTFTDWLRARSRQLLAMGFATSRSLDHALLRALLLGDHDPEMRDVQDQFKRTGTSHHLAVSGMHVAIVAGFFLLIARVLRIRPRLALLLALVIAVLYGIVTLPSPGAVRAVLICLLFSIGLLQRRSTDAIQLLALAAWLMLIWDPLDTFTPGFQLSFITVFGLIIFTPRVGKWMADLRRDPLAPPDAPPSSVLFRDGASGKNSVFVPLRNATIWTESLLARAFAAGIVAWLISMPLVAFWFEQLNPWAIPASIILAPIVILALLGGVMKILLTLALPSAAHFWAMLATAPMIAMRGTLDWLGRLPGSNYPMPAWPLWGVFLVYGIYALALLPCRIPKWRWVLRLAPIAAIFVALALPLRTLQSAVVGPRELRFTLLDVGAGQAGVLETPSGRTIMLDAGSTSLADPLGKCIAPFLLERGCTHVDTMLLSHSDYDHINAAAAVAQIYDVHQVLLGGRFHSAAPDNLTANAFLQTLDTLDVPPRTVRPGETIELSRDVNLRILWPPPTGPPADLTSNEAAVVARIEFADRSILITGDIQQIAERALLQQPQLLHADVLIAPHHGSSEDTTADFVAAVDPKYILSSNDRTLTGKQKRFDRIVQTRPLFRTDRCGAITVRIEDDGQILIEPFRKIAGTR